MTRVATLEMVRLRSRHPNTGRVTLRNVTPRFVTTLDLDLAASGFADKTTTPQVAQVVLDPQQPAGETESGKGGEAR